jgi:hypothetical protein
MSVSAKVILLVGHGDTLYIYTSHVGFGTLKGFMRMYMMVTCVPTKR